MQASLAHHFGGGVYAKETRIPAGLCLQQHIHAHDHLSILAEGVVEVTVDGRAQCYRSPAAITIAAGKSHQVKALVNSVWYCVHATEETDPDKVDAVLIA